MQRIPNMGRERDKRANPRDRKPKYIPVERGFVSVDAIRERQHSIWMLFAILFFLDDLISTVYFVRLVWRAVADLTPEQATPVVGWFFGAALGIILIAGQFFYGPDLYRRIRSHGQEAVDGVTVMAYIFCVSLSTVTTGIFHWQLWANKAITVWTNYQWADQDKSNLVFWLSLAVSAVIAILSSVVPLIGSIKNKEDQEG